MAKIITFSRFFPSYHPMKGQHTHFVEKIWSSLDLKDNVAGLTYARFLKLNENNQEAANIVYHSLTEPFNFSGEKFHTIRGGNRFKVGDKFSPRVWSGKPYQSKQVVLAVDIEVKKVWSFEMKPKTFWDECQYYINGDYYLPEGLKAVAKNDGLTLQNFMLWFAGKDNANSNRKGFKGQIICWNENTNY